MKYWGFEIHTLSQNGPFKIRTKHLKLFSCTVCDAHELPAGAREFVDKRQPGCHVDVCTYDGR